MIIGEFDMTNNNNNATKGIFSNKENMFYLYNNDNTLKIFDDNKQEIIIYPDSKFFENLGYVANRNFDKMVQLPNVYMLRDFLYKEGISSMNIDLYDDMSILFQIYVRNEIHDIWMSFDEFESFFINSRKHFEIIK